MSDVKIKELDKSLIHRANSNSMSGQRGDISAHEYEVYCQKVMSWNIPDSRKQKIVDQIYTRWSEQLRHEAAHVSVAVAGPARYNAKKLDHSDTILRLSSEFVEWFNGLQEQVWQFRAVYTKKAEPDFKGVMLGGRAVMFEAKSTGTGRLNKDRVLPEQVKKLDSYTALGAHCFIVATFDGLRVYRIPWTVWRSMKQRYGRNYVTEADIKEYAVRFGPGFTPDLLRGIPTMYDINPLSNVSDVLTAFCGMPYGTQPETEEWRAAVYRFSRFMNWTTPERFMLVNEIRREQPNMEKPIFSFMGVPITEDSAGKLKEAMKKCGVSALEVAGVCERFAKIARATLDELPDGNKEEEHDD